MKKLIKVEVDVEVDIVHNYCKECDSLLEKGNCSNIHCSKWYDPDFLKPISPTINSIVYIDKSKLHKSFQNSNFTKGRITKEVKVKIDYHNIKLMWEVCIDEVEDTRLLFSKDSVSLHPISKETSTNEIH